jgi:hypothetical protein
MENINSIEKITLIVSVSVLAVINLLVVIDKVKNKQNSKSFNY